MYSRTTVARGEADRMRFAAVNASEALDSGPTRVPLVEHPDPRCCRSVGVRPVRSGDAATMLGKRPISFDAVTDYVNGPSDRAQRERRLTNQEYLKREQQNQRGTPTTTPAPVSRPAGEGP